MYKYEELLNWYDLEYCFLKMKEHLFTYPAEYGFIPGDIGYVKNQDYKLWDYILTITNGEAIVYLKESNPNYEKLATQAIKMYKYGIMFIDIKKYPTIYEEYILTYI